MNISTFTLVCIAAASALVAPAQAIDLYSPAINSPGQRGTPPPNDARPGEMFFIEGVKAVKKNNYPFAIDMYETSASWAYKPAQYNLGVIYFNGEGVPADHARGLAWLALAAERGAKKYAAARDTAYSRMSDEEFARANELWREMKKTYRDEVALTRAKRRWVEVRNNETGSHVGGGTGPVSVGGKDSTAMNVVDDPSHPNNPKPNTVTQSSFGITGAGAVDGTVAYRQLRESDNPYDAKFKQASGEVTVQDMIPISDKVLRQPPATAKPSN